MKAVGVGVGGEGETQPSEAWLARVMAQWKGGVEGGVTFTMKMLCLRCFTAH